jgi:hypothetical protein
MVVDKANGLGLRSSSSIRGGRGRRLIHEKGSDGQDAQEKDAHMERLDRAGAGAGEVQAQAG